MWNYLHKTDSTTTEPGQYMSTPDDPFAGVGEGSFDNGFPTPSGKYELWSILLESYPASEAAGGMSRAWGYKETDGKYGDALPVVREPYASPYSEVFSEGDKKEYPIVVTSGRRNPLYFHSEQRQQPYTRELYPVPHFQINSVLANDLGIASGDWCWLETPHGKIRQVADVFDGIDPRVIECDHAWWFPELPAPTHGFNLCNINCLVDKYSRDPIYGATSLRAYMAKVYKATAENSPYGNPIPCSDEVDNDLPEGVPYSTGEQGDRHPQIITDGKDPRLAAWMPLPAERVQEMMEDAEAKDFESFAPAQPNYGREFLA
jgi:anaerobic selenocysteine-containing dehydrogenase